MRERGELRFAGRRAALHQAIRRGDAVAAARAAARMRILGQPLTSDDHTHARAARRVLGRAILRARHPALTVPAEPRPSPAAVPPARSLARRASAAAVLVAAIAFLLWPRGSEPAGGSGAPIAAPPRQVTVAAVSRGRTVAPPPDVVVVIQTPSPAPSEPPAATAAPSPAAATGPSGPPAPTGSGAGGRGGTGAGPGTGPGSGSGTPTPTPSSRPSPTSPFPPPGFTRLTFIVLDYRTGRPIPDACVIVGTSTCAPGQPHTDALGRWSADVATGSSTQWDVAFSKEGYYTQRRHFTLPGRTIVTYQIFLRRSS